MQRGYREPADFAKLTLAKGEDGYLVRLGDVARVERASEERRAYFRSWWVIDQHPEVAAVENFNWEAWVRRLNDGRLKQTPSG